MKKLIFSLLVTVLFFISSSLFAHPGALRDDKGHCDNANKEYHYHIDGKVTGASKSKYNELCTGAKSKQAVTKKDKTESKKEPKDTGKKNIKTDTKEKEDSKNIKKDKKEAVKDKTKKEDKKNVKKDKAAKSDSKDVKKNKKEPKKSKKEDKK